MPSITDEVYSSYESPRDKTVFRMARDVIFKKDYKTLLDVGCAAGDFLSFFNQPNYRYSGVDISSHLISIARARLPKSISLHCYDFFERNNNLDNLFNYDIITCFSVSGYFVNEEDFLLPLINVSSSSSTLLISGLFNMNGLTVHTTYKRSGDHDFSSGLNQLNYELVSAILSAHGFSVHIYPVIVKDIIPYNSDYPHRAFTCNFNGFSLMNGANLLLSDFLIVAER